MSIENTYIIALAMCHSAGINKISIFAHCLNRNLSNQFCQFKKYKMLRYMCPCVPLLNTSLGLISLVYFTYVLSSIFINSTAVFTNMKFCTSSILPNKKKKIKKILNSIQNIIIGQLTENHLQKVSVPEVWQFLSIVMKYLKKKRNKVRLNLLFVENRYTVQCRNPPSILSTLIFSFG